MHDFCACAIAKGPRCLKEETRTVSTAMGFGDLKTSAGLSALNDYLADKSYIEG